MGGLLGGEGVVEAKGYVGPPPLSQSIGGALPTPMQIARLVK